MKDHDGVSVLLRWEFKKTEHLIMVHQIPDSIFNDFLSRGPKLSELALCKRQSTVKAWKLTYLSRVCSHTMTQFRNNLTSLCQRFCSKRSKCISILLVACERKHLATQPHKLDTIPIIPPDHLDDITSICESDILNIALAQFDIFRLILVWPVLGCMFWLAGVFQWVSVLKN